MQCHARRQTFDRQNKLRDYWQNLCATMLEQVKNALHRQETVRILLLPQAIEEDREVVVVVQLLDLDL